MTPRPLWAPPRRSSDSTTSSYSPPSFNLYDYRRRSRFSMLENVGENISDMTWKWKYKLLHRKKSPLDEPLDLEKEYKEEEPEEINNKDPSFGADTTIQTLYEGKHSDPVRNNWDWQNFPPKQVSKAIAKARDRVAIKVYKIKDIQKGAISNRYPLKYHQVDIQNPLLVSAIEPILKKENLHLDVHDTAVFKEPFRPLWFCQDEIRDLYRNTKQDDPLKGYLQLLLRVLDEMFRDLKIKRRNLLDKDLIDFRTAWTLFPRDSTAYSYGMNSEFIAKVDGTEYDTNEGVMQLVLTAKVMAFNGEEFIWRKKSLTINEFAGNKPIRDLRHYPFEMHPEKDAIEQRLVSRGRKVLDLQGLAYCSYNGIALHPGESGVEKHNVEGRILVDVVGYNKHHLAQGKRENKDPEIEVVDTSRRRRRQDLADAKPEGKQPKTQQKRLNEEDQTKNREELLQKPKELAFMTELIGGYALKNKLWVYFYVEDLEPIVWNDQAYSHLVFDEQQKDLVLSFVENHSLANGAKTAMEDVIVGKGQGLIMLLSGPPGTGKTLMAEAIADRTHRPLFYLQAEDLGINAAALGANIKRVFEMATEWNAVILLDEADVFMAERNPNDIHRNELVSIFLRELEYYRGIIFLTTNLYHTIDTAFRSRVSLHLLFKSLTREARETVWRKFLQRLSDSNRITDVTDESPATGSTTPRNAGTDQDTGGEITAAYEDKPLDDEDIAELSLWQLNGREIKTAIKMVRSWCDHKGYIMTLSRLENGIKVTSPHSNKDGDVDKDLYE
ncbi:ATP-dependent zinc metalloprotease FTSH 11, chloroplastic mitochondrial [Fusarium agapanthi]|uniref:ATP-dependent zinc metalloprotease FTSH 11, chloroplastic mitochondrial n=1 Tax=Fusarium agapanthi TaxID=1803897 RepID=A0A9P5E4M4_9HYPO|nr:ATP-dependent zinc metalloprotease FTSH 11, chloroplastic mitochondrial [Fusarium agapanthi]